MIHTRPSARTVALLALAAITTGGAATARAAGDNPPAPERTTLLVGEVDTKSGAFTHTLPFELPAARRGLTPSLGLGYSSATVEGGLAGAGWEVRGLSAIVRVPGDRGLRFDGADTYAFAANGWSGSLPGPDDVLIDRGGGRYHPARGEAGRPMMEFSVDTTLGLCGDLAPNHGPCGWIGKDGLGNVFKYSTVANARLWEPANGVTAGRGVQVWALYQVIDAEGNYWQVTYTNTSATIYPAQVEYNLPRAGATPRSMRVDFAYTARTDLTPAPFRFPVVLNHVRVLGHCTAAGCSLIRLYQLAHTTSPTSGRRLLTSFQEYGSDAATTLPAQTFQYTSGPLGPAAITNSTNGFTDLAQCEAFRSSGALCAWQTHVGDLDGDGKDDVVRFFAGGTGPNNATRTFLVEYTCGRSDGLTGPRLSVPTTALLNYTDTQGIQPPIDGWKSVLTDIDGDGKQDLAIVNPTATPTTSEQQNLVTGVHLSAIAFGGYNGAPCSLSGLQAVSREQVRDVPWSNGPHAPTAWSVQPSDGDGHGRGGVLLIDHLMNQVHEKSSTGTGLGQVFVTDVGSPAGCSYRQWQSGDVDGDGRQDVDAFAYASDMLCFLSSAARGTNGSANYTTFTEAVTSIAPPVNLGYDVVRAGDLNGDGRTDFLFNYQGPVVDNVGRDLRYWLGSTTTAPNPIRLWLRSAFPFPGASLAGGHLNEWEYLVGDVTGDGLDDAVQVYLGSEGVRINQAISTPSGPGALTTHTSASGAMPDNAPADFTYNKWHAVLADVNGDGLKDLAYGKYANLIAPNANVLVGIYLGTPTGLSTTLRFLTNQATGTGGDSRNVALRTGDINGDGKDDLLFVNDNVADPSNTNPRIAFAMTARNLPLVPAVQDTPDLLRAVDNGLRATRTVEYKLAGDFASAVAPAALGCNGATAAPGAGHWVTGATCGNTNATPRPLVARVVDDDGRGFVTSTAYDYHNGRVLPGRRLARADLGFGRVRQTSEQTAAFEESHYRQEKPYQGLVRDVAIHAGDVGNTRMSRTVVSYAEVAPYAGIGITTVQRTREDHAVYNRANTPASFTGSRLFAYDPVHGNLTRVTELDDAAGYDAVTEYGYRAADLPTWTVGRLDSVRVKGFDLAAPGGYRVLAMQRMTYDDLGARPWRLTRAEELHFDRFDQASCASYGDPWLASTCAAEITAKLARWVTVQQAFVYDAQGNVTQFDGVRVQNDDLTWNNHRLRFQYDPHYAAHVARQTNDLNQTVDRTYDLAARPLTETDANARTTTTTYDVLGRVTAVVAPGLAGTGTTIAYLQLGDAANQRYEVTTSSAAGVTATSAYYLDGRGQTWKQIDRSPIGDVQHLRSRAYVGGTLRERASEPHFAGGPPLYLQHRYDSAGRLVAIDRVNASFVLERALVGIAHQDDGGVIVTDANGHTNRIYKNARGLTTRVTDALGNDTRYVYNAAWLRSRVTLPGNVHVDLAYDGRFRPYSVNDPTASGFNRFSVDDAGRLMQVTYLPTPTSPSTAATRRTRYAYDLLDRVAREYEVTSTGETLRVTKTYDQATSTNGKGRLTSVVDPSGTTTFGYDARGNVTRKVHTLDGLAGAYTYDYTYNDRDLLTSRTFPSGGPWSATDQGTETYSYTADGVMTDIHRGTTPWAKWSGWNAHRKPAMAYRHWNGVEWAHMTEYEYAPDQTLSAMTTWTADGDIELDNLYTYDAVGNLTSITDRRLDTLQGSIETDATQGFTYDALGRLVGSTDNLGPAQSHGYDALGNTVTDNGTVTTTVACGTLVCQENRTGATLNWRTYQDSEGKRTRFDDYAGGPVSTYHYNYDWRGRLASVVKDGFTKETFRYDHADQRTHETFLHPGNQYTTTTWHVGDAYAVRAASDFPARFARTVDIAGVAHWTTGDLIRNQASEAGALSHRDSAYLGAAYYGPAQGTYIDVPDHKGSPVLTTHPDGSLVTRHWLEAWGTPRASASSGWAPATVDRYNAFATSDYSKLLYAGSRYYHAKTHRFLTPDDRIVDGGAQGFNRYAYATNNPPSYREDGHSGQPVSTSTPGGVVGTVFTGVGWFTTTLATSAVIADALSLSHTSARAFFSASPYSLGVMGLSLGIHALVPGLKISSASRYFTAVSQGFGIGGGPSVMPGTGTILSRVIIDAALRAHVGNAAGLLTYGQDQLARGLLEFGKLRWAANLGPQLMLFSWAVILAQAGWYTWHYMSMTPQEALKDIESRNGPVKIDPNIVLTPDGGWRWKKQIERDAEERKAAQDSGVGYPVVPGEADDAGGDFGPGDGGGDGGFWNGDGDGPGGDYGPRRPTATIEAGEPVCDNNAC